MFAGFHLQFVALCALLRPKHIEVGKSRTLERTDPPHNDLEVETMIKHEIILQGQDAEVDGNEVPEVKTRTCGRTHWVIRTFIYCMGVCFGIFLHAGVVVYSPVRSWHLGLTKHQGALLVSIINICGGLVRIPTGFVGDLKCVNRGYVLSASLAMVGVLTLVSTIHSSFLWLTIYSGLYGAISGRI